MEGNDLPDWVWNKVVQGGNSRKRLDLLLNFGNRVIIVEIDEQY